MNKIYIMGCGRSGTTFLLTLMTSFQDTYVHIDAAPVPGEDHFRAFDSIKTEASTVVVKRVSDAYKFIYEMPDQLKLLYLVRHPLDVVTSTLNYRGKTYKNYIPPERWLAETKALRSLIESQRQGVFLLRYEDLVLQPDTAQRKIGDYFGLKIDTLFSRCHERFIASEDIDATLNGLRPPDASSIGRWKSQQHMPQLTAVLQEIESELEWFCAQFGYDQAEINQILRAPQSTSTTPT